MYVHRPAALGPLRIRRSWLSLICFAFAEAPTLAQLGNNYCATNPNSSGVVGELGASGSNDVILNAVTLYGSSLPASTFAMFLVSRDAGFVANPQGSAGNLCLGGSIGRYSMAVQPTGGAGVASLLLDLGDIPNPTVPFSVVSGDTLRFQLWFRDLAQGVASSNFSRGLEVTFGAGCSGPLFDDERVNVSVQPRGVELRDFDGDGRVDLITGGGIFGTAAISVRLNRGDAEFSAAADIVTLTGGSLNAFAVGDVDGDGDQDLAWAGSHGLYVGFNDGSGAIALNTTYLGVPGASEVQLADMDGDGDLDLAAALESMDRVVLYENLGAGLFGAPVSHAVGGTPVALAFADLNADGAPDLVAAVDGVGFVSVLFNNGGVFGNLAQYSIQPDPTSIAVGDFDGDGDTDLAVTSATTDTVSILRSQGTTGLLQLSTFGAGDGPQSVRSSDLDGDGDLDLVAANLGDGTLSLLLNDGAAGFNTQLVVEVPRFTSGVALGDLDQDGTPDLVAYGSGRGVQVLRNRGVSNFRAPRRVPTLAGPSGARLVDLNGDGDLDVVAVHTELDVTSALLGNGDGTFGPVAQMLVGSRPVQLNVLDLDRDGDRDVVTLNQASADVSLLYNLGNGTFAPEIHVDLNGASPNGLAQGDIDGNGEIDLVVTAPSRGVGFLFQSGGAFAPVRWITTGGSIAALQVGDLDGDGALDVAMMQNEAILQGFERRLAVLRNLGGGVFASAVTVMLPPAVQANTRASGLVLADLEGDGDLDIAISNLGSGSGFHGVDVLRNRGDGTFDAAESVSTLSDDLGIQVGDLDGDGALDLVVTGLQLGSFAWLRNLGAGRFGEARWFGLDVSASSVEFGDLDGDGDLDAVFPRSFEANLGVGLGLCR